MFEESKLDWLKLPSRNYGELNERLQYGADRVVADFCGLKNVPKYFDGHWQHGWMAPYFNQDTDHVIAEKVFDKIKEPCFVARKDQENYLVKKGYISTAIGLPIAYTKPSFCQRKKNSLLVMPAHSNSYTKHKWKFEMYAEEINKIRDFFSEIVICIHEGCVKNNYWINEFSRYGFPIIIGADARDFNSLTRMRHLIEQFEYATTNAYGSCIAYAAAFGSKISIYGSFSEPSIDDFSTVFDLFSKKIWEETIYLQSERKTREELPELFIHPAGASERVDWGLKQIGYENIRSSKKLKQLFGWNLTERMRREAIKKFWQLEIAAAKHVPPTFKSLLKAWFSAIEKKVALDR